MKRIITKSVAAIIMLAMLCTFTMPAPVEAKKVPKISRASVTLTITKKKTKPVCRLKVKNASGKIKWKSSNKKVATVNKSGKITAKKKGRATITAKTGKKTLRCRVTVKDSRKAEIPAPAKPEPSSNPTPSPTPECEHVYEDHKAVFEAYYEPASVGAIRIPCCCGMFCDEDSYEKHMFMVQTVLSLEDDGFDGSENAKTGMHSAHAKTSTERVEINGKWYDRIRTEYIDKRTCTKCGKVLSIEYDKPDQLKSVCPEGRCTPVNPYD